MLSLRIILQHAENIGLTEGLMDVLNEAFQGCRTSVTDPFNSRITGKSHPELIHTSARSKCQHIAARRAAPHGMISVLVHRDGLRAYARLGGCRATDKYPVKRFKSVRSGTFRA